MKDRATNPEAKYLLEFYGKCIGEQPDKVYKRNSLLEDNILIVQDHALYVRKLLIGILSTPLDTYYDMVEKQKRDLVIREFVQGAMKKEATKKDALTLEDSANAVNRETIINTINKTKDEILDELRQSTNSKNGKLSKSGPAQNKKKNNRQKKIKSTKEQSRKKQNRNQPDNLHPNAQDEPPETAPPPLAQPKKEHKGPQGGMPALQTEATRNNSKNRPSINRQFRFCRRFISHLAPQFGICPHPSPSFSFSLSTN